MPFRLVPKGHKMETEVPSFLLTFPHCSNMQSQLEFSISLGMMQQCPKGRTSLSLKIKDEHSSISFTHKMLVLLWHWTEFYYMPPQTKRSSLSCPNKINILVDERIMKSINNLGISTLLLKWENKASASFKVKILLF